MSRLWDAIIQAYAALAIVPVIPFLMVYIIVTLRGGERKKAIQTAMDITTIFLFGIVTVLLKERTGSNFGFYFMLLLMLIGAGLLGNVQNRVRGKIHPSKIFRAVWRLSFFAMSLLYVILMSLKVVFPPASTL